MYNVHNIEHPKFNYRSNVNSNCEIFQVNHKYKILKIHEYLAQPKIKQELQDVESFQLIYFGTQKPEIWNKIFLISKIWIMEP